MFFSGDAFCCSIIHSRLNWRLGQWGRQWLMVVGVNRVMPVASGGG